LGGTLDLDIFGGSSFTFRDNFFDRTLLYDYGAALDRDYNAYIVGFTWDHGGGLWSPTPDDVILTDFTYATGPLGDYYQGSPDLIDAGSRSAVAAGLACATTRADHQPDEGLVDIGLHYRLTGDPPTASTAQFSTCRNRDLELDLSPWVWSPRGCPLEWTLVSEPTHGVLLGDLPIATYQPHPGYCGADGFTFKVSDGVGDSEPTEVTIHVGEPRPSATGDTKQTCKNTPINFSLNGSDPCSPTPTFAQVTAPEHAQSFSLSPEGTISYTPALNFCGVDTFTFKVVGACYDSEPATVTIAVGGDFIYAPYQTVMVAADTPRDIHLCASHCNGSDGLTFDIATDPEHGELEEGATPGHYIFTPYQTTPPYTGSDSFTFTVSNCGHESFPGTVNVVIVPGLETLAIECRPATIILTWDASAIPATYGLTVDGFEVYRSTMSGGPYTLLTPVPLPGTETTFVDATAAPSTAYYYVVKFIHNEPDCRSPGQFISYPSPFSNEVTASTCCPDPEGGFWTDDTPSAQQLAEWIMVGSGITVVPDSAAFGGAALTVPKMRGIFGNGSDADLPIESGVMLCSGDIALARGPNNNIGGLPGSLEGAANGDQLGDSDLNGLVTGLQTRDAAVLTFDVTAPTNNTPIEFKYVFASEEYHFYIGPYNDIMAIWVDGENIAVVPGSSPPEPVSVNSIHNGYAPHDVSPRNPQLFVDNETSLPGPLNIQYNGLTVLLTTTNKTISAGSTHHVKIAVADASDQILDSALFIKASTPCP
jgi:hypothetical protein